jgi:AcrR family transcriptional regulator
MPPSRRDDLINAAMKVFYRNGFHCTGLDKVLQEGGISRMTLYNHFKSKDELIVAALRRRDEIFRNRMMKFVEARASDPLERILAIFDYHAQWFADKDFHGCMFINASAEYTDPKSPIRRVAADHKCEVTRYLQAQLESAQLRQPALLAQQLCILLDGAIVNAQVVGQVGIDGATPEHAAHTAKLAAQQLLEAARSATP